MHLTEKHLSVDGVDFFGENVEEEFDEGGLERIKGDGRPHVLLVVEDVWRETCRRSPVRWISIRNK